MVGVINRMPLRVRLVVASTVLVALGLAMSGFVASTVLRGYLVDRIDGQLRQASQHFGGPGFRGGPPLGGAGPRGAGDTEVDSNLYTAFYSAAGGAPRIRFQPDYGPASQATPTLPAAPRSGALVNAGMPFTVPSIDGDTSWRVVARPIAGGGQVLVAQSLSDVDHTVGRLQLLELLIGLGVVVVLAGAGYFVVRRSLRPLTEVERTAAAIAHGDLTQRVPEAHPGTEVGRLSAALNTMLGQIERAFHVQRESEQSARRSEEQMRQFVADASHELRTPLTSIRGFAELFRQGAVSDPEELERVMRRIEDEGARMGVLVDDLLLLARLDQHRPLQRQPVDLGRLASDAVEDVRMVAPGRPVHLVVDDAEPPVVVGDELRLRQVLGNLLGNALTHTPDGTPIHVRLGTRIDDSGRWAVLEVADEGPGLDAEHADRVFERFYRADAARTRAHGGSGLGLSIVAGLADAHGGRVELETAPGEGATFRVLLPLAAAPDVATV
jgi:two-component system OmpR family sensor kinase